MDIKVTLKANEQLDNYSCFNRRNMRDSTSIKSHQDLMPYMTECRHMTCVHAAAQLGCLDCLRWMVEHIGLHPNEPDTRYGATPLHYACSSGHVKLVKFLLPRIIKVPTDFDGATPLHDAAVQGHLACLQELLKSSLVDPNITDNYGLTAAEWAEQAQEKKCAKLLRDAMRKSTAVTLTKKKKGANNSSSKSDKHSTYSTAPAFSQYSDSTESYSSSPASEIYAQLEPLDCNCETPQPPGLPPRLPDTPRPSRIKKAESQPSSPSKKLLSRSKSEKMETKPKSRASSKDRKHSVGLSALTDLNLPPPPDSMLESMYKEQTTPLRPPKDLPPPLSPTEANDMVFPENGHYESTNVINQGAKPMSAVQPFNHIISEPLIPEQLNIPKHSTHVVIDVKSQTTSSTGQSSTPNHSFSTFKENNYQSMRQVSNQTYMSGQLYESPQHIYQQHYQSTSHPVPHQAQHNHNGYDELTHRMNNLHANNQSHHHSQHYVNTPGHNLPPPPVNYQNHTQIPAWKQQILASKISKSRECDNPPLPPPPPQVAEVPDSVPNWKRIINERRQTETPTTSISSNHGSGSYPDIIEPPHLAPWQEELRNSGRTIPLD